MTEALSREEELYAARLLALSDWGLPETLFWIMYRSPASMARALEFGRSEALTKPAPYLIEECRRLAQETPTVESEPAAALDIALLEGSVVAMANPSGLRSHLTRTLAREDWQHMSFREATVRNSPNVAIDRRDFRGPHMPGGVYPNLRFKAASVRGAFPVSEPTLPPWAPRGRSILEWLRDPETEREARRRLGADKLIKAKWARILAEMHNEAAPGEATKKADNIRRGLDESGGWPADLVT